jgi:hypothetical protein
MSSAKRSTDHIPYLKGSLLPDCMAFLEMLNKSRAIPHATLVQIKTQGTLMIQHQPKIYSRTT